jgi:hypothetical protein
MDIKWQPVPRHLKALKQKKEKKHVLKEKSFMFAKEEC